MSEDIIISVVFPALNEEKLIKHTLSQFTPEIKSKFKIEVIVSDGGSSDTTVEISSALADAIFKPEPGTKENIAVGRNLGVKNSHGKYYYIMNADTRIKDINMFFELTLREFEKPKVLAQTCKVKVFPEEQKLSDILFHFFYNNYVRSLNLIGLGMGRGECHIIRKEVFERVSGYNETMAAGEDFDLFRRIKKFGKIKSWGSLVVYESPRRYRKFGYPKVFWDWTKNAASVMFKNKAISQEWEQVR